MHAFLIGIMVVALCWAFGSNCMAAVNPARDFPPRVLSALVGYGAETFSYRQFWWIPLFVPHLGGFIGTWLYVLFVGMHIPKPRRDGDEKEVVNLLPLAPRADGDSMEIIKVKIKESSEPQVMMTELKGCREGQKPSRQDQPNEENTALHI
uniref:Putative aquaporin major intrinsic protein family n=1 Tax=Ixodes scapularis TaxID=6945 RepID=A0A4D5RZB6_IXOSC